MDNSIHRKNIFQVLLQFIIEYLIASIWHLINY